MVIPQLQSQLKLELTSIKHQALIILCIFAALITWFSVSAHAYDIVKFKTQEDTIGNAKEPACFVYPTNKKKILAGFNGTSSGVLWSKSSDSGESWSTLTSLPVDSSLYTASGDPAVCVTSNGTLLFGRLVKSSGNASPRSLLLHRSTNDGTSWSTINVDSALDADGPDIWVDLSGSSNYSGRVYMSWGPKIWLRYSTDNGSTWSSRVMVQDTIADGLISNHPELATAPWGTVLCIYPRNPTTIGLRQVFQGVGISRSHDGGITWSQTNLSGHLVQGPNTMSGKKFKNTTHVGVAFNSKTKTALAVWTNFGTPGGSYDSTNADIYAYRSADSGRTWTSMGRVNTVSTNSQWKPTLVCDQATGYYACLYYDDRTTSESFHAYAAVSLDDGATWSDYKLSDVPYTPTEIASNDYLALHADSNYFYPIWTNGSESSFKAVTRPFTIDCCTGPRGNADGDASNSCDISDVSALTGYLYYGDALLCTEEADVNASGGVDSSDLTYMLNYLFYGGPAPSSCP